MKLPVESWDGELAVRLPEWLVERFGIAESDEGDVCRLEEELVRAAEVRRQGGGALL